MPTTKLLAVGGSRQVAHRVEDPVLYHFVGSFNSGKATLVAQISTKRDDFDFRLILHQRDNYMYVLRLYHMPIFITMTLSMI